MIDTSFEKLFVANGHRLDWNHIKPDSAKEMEILIQKMMRLQGLIHRYIENSKEIISLWERQREGLKFEQVRHLIAPHPQDSVERKELLDGINEIGHLTGISNDEFLGGVGYYNNINKVLSDPIEAAKDAWIDIMIYQLIRRGIKVSKKGSKEIIKNASEIAEKKRAISKLSNNISHVIDQEWLNINIHLE